MTDGGLPRANSGTLVRELMDCVEDIAIILDPKLRVLEANRAALLALGYAAPELAGRRLASLMEPKAREALPALARGLRERRGEEAVFLTSSRRRLFLRFSLSPLAGEGEASFLLVGRLSDGKGASRIAEATNGFAERILRGFSDPVFLIDGASRTVIDCNSAALAVFGYAREDFVGWRLLGHIAGEEEGQWGERLMRSADKAYAELGFFRERLLVPRKNGPALPCDFLGLPFFREDGSLSFIIGMLFDRSAEEAREAELASLSGRAASFASDLAAALRPRAGGETGRLSALGFTARQIQIVRLLSLGLSSKEIGSELGIAESTVRNHLSVMFRKLHVESRMAFMYVLTERRIRIA